jgi:hypothetical protein
VLLALVASSVTVFSQAGSSAGRAQAFECGVLDVLIVTDLAFYGNRSVDAARGELLDLFSKSQSYFNSAFDVELKMYVRDIIAPIDESPFPAPEAKVDGMNDVNMYMKKWLAEHNYDFRAYDLVLGVSFTQYNVQYWGYCFGEDNILATIVMQLRGGEEVVVRLMAHEIGHAFGATHDPAGTSLMSPLIDGGGSWSAKNKEEVNAFLARERIKSLLGVCPTLALDGTVDGMNISLNWSVNYERDVTDYVLYENGVLIDTVEAKGPSTGPLQYTFQHTTDSGGEKVYWLHQISKWGTVMDNENAVFNIGEFSELTFDGYPNPFLDSLKIMPVEPGTKVLVFNSLNQRVVEHTASGNAITLNTSGWTPGLYFIKNGTRGRRVIRR